MTELKLKEKELPIVTSLYMERNVGQWKVIRKFWAVKMQIEFLKIRLQVIFPIN